MDKFVVRKKDAKAPPAQDTKVLDADLPPLQYTSLSLVRTGAQILFRGFANNRFTLLVPLCSGCILGVTIYSPYVKTIVEDCIDRILSVFRELDVKLVKGGESYVGDK